MPNKVPEPWSSLIAEWARALRAENKSDRTIRCYTDSARWFHLWTSEHPEPPAAPDQITPSQVRAWIVHRLDTTSAGNANNNYRALQQWFRWLLDEEEIEVHPMQAMKPPNVPDRPVPVVPDDLIRKVLGQCTGRDLISRRDAAIVRLIWDTGARLSEVANLTLDDLDLNIDVISVVGKGGKPRAVPFAPKTGQALSRYLRVRSRERMSYLPELWLADRNRGALHANGIKLMLRRRGKAAGINEAIGRNLHAHLGRHSAAHHAQAEGMSEGDLMLIMGWSSAEMPKRYGRSAATERAHATVRRLRLGDRL